MKKIFIIILFCLLMFPGFSESVERKKGETFNENLIFTRNVTSERNNISLEFNLILDFTVRNGTVYTATQGRSASQSFGTELSDVDDFYNTWIINFCGQIRTVIDYTASKDGDDVVIGRFTLDSVFGEEPATGSNMRLVDPDNIVAQEQVILKIDTEQQIQIGGDNDIALINNGIDELGGESGLTNYDITDETAQFFVDIAKPVKTDSINVATLCTPFSAFAASHDVWLEKIGIFLDSVPAGTRMRVFLEGDSTLNARYPLIENVTIDEFKQGLGDPVSVSTFADVNTWNLTSIKIPAIVRIFSIFILNFTFSDANGDPVFLDVPIDTSVTDSPFFADVRADNIQSASGTAITLDTGADPADDSYNGMRLYIGSEFRNIIDYNGTTKVATVDSAYTTAPSPSDPYIIKIAFIRPMMVFEHAVTVKSRIQNKNNRRDYSFSDDGTELEIGTVSYVDTTGGAPTFTVPGQQFQSIGAWFEIVDKEDNFDTNNVTIDFSVFDLFEGGPPDDFIINEKGVRATFRYESDPFGWTVEKSRLFTDISVKITKTTDQSIPRNILTMVNWDSEEYDTDGMHDNVTNNSRITFQTAGKYSILAQSEWGINSGGFRFMDIMKNGVDSIARVRNLAENASEHNIAFVGEFAVGDYIQLEVFQDTGGNLDFESGAILENTYLEAHKIN